VYLAIRGNEHIWEWMATVSAGASNTVEG
jgi:hypothetical protein